MKRGGNVGKINRGEEEVTFFLCLILPASLLFCEFLSFSINPPAVISFLYYIPIRLVKARVF